MLIHYFLIPIAIYTMSASAFESLASSRRNDFETYMNMTHQVFIAESAKEEFLAVLYDEINACMKEWPQMKNLLSHFSHYILEFMPEEYAQGQDIMAEARYMCNVLMRNLIYVETDYTHDQAHHVPMEEEFSETFPENCQPTNRTESMDTEIDPTIGAPFSVNGRSFEERAKDMARPKEHRYFKNADEQSDNEDMKEDFFH